ncbi:MAG TPA: glycosyltransferase [Pseudonocardiaceae bacterium]
MRVLLFGTYDTAMHPRVATLAEGLRAHGVDVPECDRPLGLSTAARVGILAKPWRLPLLLLRIIHCWTGLAWAARRFWRGSERPDAVLVGYLGHFDVHLARLLFPRVPIVLDHLVGASDTGRDRGLGGGPRGVLLRLIDSAALRTADIVLVDTAEHLAALPDRHRDRGVVLPVGAPHGWFTPDSTTDTSDSHGRPLRVVFFGLYTPLQGAPVIGAALSRLAGEPVEVTMIGHGQDEAATRAAAGAANTTSAGSPGLANTDAERGITWLDWVPAEKLPALVADHDVCLGIFGTGPKALRVVPNKVFQGAAAGCAIVTSDTPPQRRMLGAAAVLVPPGDPDALADALRGLAGDRAELRRMRKAAHDLATREFAPEHVVAPLLANLLGTARSGRRAVPSSR